MQIFLGLIVMAAAVYAILRRVDVRLTLLVAALALGCIALNPGEIIRQFFLTLTNQQFVVPICCAMGFAYVLKQTGCDQHLVHLLVRPLRRVQAFLIPGTVLVGFLVNIPVVSQTSTVVVIGSVLVPLLRAAGISAVTAGAALLLGCSIGGELLNPGAPEFRTITEAASVPGQHQFQATECVVHVFPLVLPHLVLATAVFWILSLKFESQGPKDKESQESGNQKDSSVPPELPVNFLKAAVPFVPIVLLFLTGPPLQVFVVPKEWLVKADDPTDVPHFESRLIGAAMLIGVVVASLTAGRGFWETTKSFFEGTGYALARIISVIIAATCFGTGVKEIGLAKPFSAMLAEQSFLLIAGAGLFPLAFGWVCGSGMASTQSLYGFFVDPARSLQISPLHVGAVVSIAAAAGRTMSPVAAVTLMCATLTETDPFQLIRRVALPLLAGMGGMIVIAMLMALN